MERICSQIPRSFVWAQGRACAVDYQPRSRLLIVQRGDTRALSSSSGGRISCRCYPERNGPTPLRFWALPSFVAAANVMNVVHIPEEEGRCGRPNIGRSSSVMIGVQRRGGLSEVQPAETFGQTRNASRQTCSLAQKTQSQQGLRSCSRRSSAGRLCPRIDNPPIP